MRLSENLDAQYWTFMKEIKPSQKRYPVEPNMYFMFTYVQNSVCQAILKIWIEKIKKICFLKSFDSIYIYIYIYIDIFESHLSSAMWEILYWHINAFICCSVKEQQIGVAFRGYSMLCDSL